MLSELVKAVSRNSGNAAKQRRGGWFAGDGMSCATLRVIDPFLLQRTRGSLC
jgi:hypothetical protein